MSESVLIRSEDDRRRASWLAGRAADGALVTIKPAGKSDRQRALFHALLTELAQRCVWKGRRLTVDQWKDVFVIALWGCSYTRSPLDPAIRIIARRSTESLTVAEYSELIDFTRAEAETELGYRWLAHRPGEEG